MISKKSIPWPTIGTKTGEIPMKRKYKIVITGSRWEGTEKYLIVPTWPNGDVDIDNVETWNSYAYAADARDIYQRKENESNVC